MSNLAHTTIPPSLNLRFSTSILKRLGEELNVSADRGVLELVKNAYDADATTCTVHLNGVTRDGGTLRVEDDGDGMTREQIEDGWLVLGASEKEVGKTSRLGRPYAGNKGLGRLAALRMGRTAVLATRPRDRRELGTEYTVELPWDEFDAADLVEEVDVDLGARGTTKDHGTTLEVRGLRERVSRSEATRLARGLLLLADPFGDAQRGFQIRLSAPEFPDLEDRVETGYLDEAEYHLVAEVGPDGLASATVRDFRGNVLYEASHEDLRDGTDEPYPLPLTRFDFWVYVLDKETFASHDVSIKEVRDWLRSFGGVYLYIGDLRVAPYGETGDDWLGVNLLRAQRPYLRPSTRTSIGRVRIQPPAPDFVQKTDREGLVENDAFSALRQFGRDAQVWLYKVRLETREAQRAREKEEAKTEVEEGAATVEDAIGDLPDTERTPVQAAFEAYRAANERERDALQQEIQLYRTLSTVGIVAATFAHESQHPVSLIQENAEAVRLRARKLLNGAYDAYLRDSVDIIIRQGGVLGSFGAVALNLAKRGQRRSQQVKLHKTLGDLAVTLAPLLDERETDLDLQFYPGDPFLYASPAAIESVATNLIVNSLRALEGRDERKIVVRTEPIDVPTPTVQLTVSDTGPGIEGLTLREIWLPGQTTREGGTGYGLTIVRDTVRELGGSVDALVRGDLGGATISATLPVIEL
ncbi:MAG: hypothetical protein SangKO_099860 [Sandaracinaceae bacterium]